MDRINYKKIKELNYDGYLLETGTEKIIQFGEGNFLRGFVDDLLDVLNEKENFQGKVVVVQPIETGRISEMNQQEGLYTLYRQGIADGVVKDEKRIISCISRGISPYTDYDQFLALAEDEQIQYIISNTTEAGIVYDESCGFEDRPPASFPAKLTRLLFERFVASRGGRGFLILPCELIDDNGKRLKECVLKHSQNWNLGEGFSTWLEENTVFCNTLVDRIVTGYPQKTGEELKQKNGYEDTLLNTAEVFGFWVIEGPDYIGEKLPFERAGLPVLITKDYRPYKTRKVRILNGAHTCMVPIAYLTGQTIVRESMEDDHINRFMQQLIYEEIIPTIPLPAHQLRQFAQDVFSRFANPYIDHRLEDIALNSISKWTARVKPSLKDYFAARAALPDHIIFAFAALVLYYKNEKRKDEKKVIDFFAQWDDFQDNKGFLCALLQREDFFQEDLTRIPGFLEQVSHWADTIEQVGMQTALHDFVGEG